MKALSRVTRRMLKIAVICLCLSGFTIQTVQFLVLYWTYPTVMDIQEFLPMEIDLPGISFCNSNGLRPQAFCRFKGFCYPPIILKPLKMCNTFPKLCMYTDKPPSGMNVVTYNSFLMKYNVNASIMDTMKMPVGEFLNCKIIRGNEEVNCSMEDIIEGSYYSDTEMFNLCYTINSLWGNPDKKIEKIKKYDKIILDFFVDLSLQGRSESLDTIKPPKFNLPNTYAAIQLAVHSPYTTVNPFVSGLVFLGGKKYQVKLNMQDKHLLPSPYQTNCTDYMSTWRSRGGSGPLNQMMAVEECKVNKSLERLGCVPFLVDYPHNETVCKYCSNCPEISDIESECNELLHVYNQPCEDLFKELVNKKNLHISQILRAAEHMHFCPLDRIVCDFSTYQMNAIERSVFVEKILTNQDTGENESMVFVQKGYNCSAERTWMQRCQELSIEILFDDFLLTNLTYNPKIESMELFSVIGGYMGMYLGVSLVTGFDVADRLLAAFLAILKKKQKNKGKRSKKKVYVESTRRQHEVNENLRRRYGQYAMRLHW